MRLRGVHSKAWAGLTGRAHQVWAALSRVSHHHFWGRFQHLHDPTLLPRKNGRRDRFHNLAPTRDEPHPWCETVAEVIERTERVWRR